jgi:hypothetical protein
VLHSELQKLGPLTSVCCGLLTLAVLWQIFSYQTKATAEAEQTTSWQKCTGIVDSTYKERDNSTYVRYVYQVGSKKYIGQRIYFDQLGAGSLLSDKDSYQNGQSITVFYDPKNPDSAVLRTGPQNDNTNFLKYGLGLILGLGLIIAGLRPRAQRRVNRI